MSEQDKYDMLDRVWAEEPGVEVLIQYRNNGSLKLEIIKDGLVIASASLSAWRWDRLRALKWHKNEVKP